MTNDFLLTKHHSKKSEAQLISSQMSQIARIKLKSIMTFGDEELAIKFYFIFVLV